MTDTEKIKLIGKLINNVYEFTDCKESVMETLVVCVDSIVEFADAPEGE